MFSQMHATTFREHQYVKGEAAESIHYSERTEEAAGEWNHTLGVLQNKYTFQSEIFIVSK